MQPKHFNMLALAAVISLIAAGVVHSSFNSWTDDSVTGQRLFPSLATAGGATTKILIQKGEEKLTLEKSSDGKAWGMVERGGYPVDSQKVRKLVVSLADAELIERKTSKEKLYDQLDLGDPTKKDTSAKLLRLMGKNGDKIAEVVVGGERRGEFGAGTAGTYVRVPGAPQTWLAKLELNASSSVDDWVKPVFFRVDEKKIKSLVIRDGDKVVYKLAAKDKKPGEFDLADLPAGKEKKDDLRIDDLINGIRTLEMKDVRAATDADGKPDMTAEIEMEGGAKYRVGMKREDGKPWMTVAVVADGKAEDARKLAAATKGWAFEIADWRSKQTFKKADDVFKEAKAEAPKLSLPPGKAGAPAVPTGSDPANAPAPKN